MAYTRVEEKTVAQTPGTRDYYDIALTLSMNGLDHGRIGGRGVGGFPYVPSLPSIVQQVSGQNSTALTMPSPIGAGNTLVAALAERGAGISWSYAAEGWTLCPDGESVNGGGDAVGIFYKHTDGSESQSITPSAPMIHTSGTFYEIAGAVLPDKHSEATGGGFTITSGSITPSAGFIVGIGAQGVGGGYDSVAAGVHYAVGSGWTEDHDSYTAGGGHPTVVTGHRFDAGTYAFEATNELPSGDAWIGQVVSFVSTGGGGQAPMPGQWVRETATPAADNVTTTFYTSWSFADGSLRVTVSGTDQTGAIASYDGAAGSFTLAFAPTDAGEQPIVSYLGRAG